MDKRTTLEGILREKGEGVKRGRLVEGAVQEGEGGDVEFWDDGTIKRREGKALENVGVRVEGKGDGESP